MSGPLREAHAHIASHGRALSMLDLSGCRGVGECLDLLAREAERVRRVPGAWVLGHGARAEAWAEARWPTLEEIDRRVPDRPCAVMSFDHHAVMANSLALEVAGMKDRPDDPPDGMICRDRSGRATGLLLERCARQLWDAAPEPTAQERRGHVSSALRDLAGHGFVEVHDLLSQPWLGPVLASLDDAGELPAAVSLYVPLDDVEDAARGAAAWRCDRVRLAGAKVFADGTLNSRTAWMLEPYHDPLPGMACGKALMGAGEIAAAVERCAGLGLGLAVHAIGDAAVRAALDGVERAGPAARASHVRIEHCELIDDRDVGRFAALGVVASVQPCHLLYDIEALRRYLPHRLDRVLPLRQLIDSGCKPGELLWFGSDVPIVRADPADSILAATVRRRSGMTAFEAIAPGQAVTENEAWRSFTRPSLVVCP